MHSALLAILKNIASVLILSEPNYERRTVQSTVRVLFSAAAWGQQHKQRLEAAQRGPSGVRSAAFSFPTSGTFC